MEPFWTTLRDAVDTHGLYRMNPGWRNKQELSKYWLAEDMVSLSDWGLDRKGITLQPESGEVCASAVADKFRDTTAGKIRWDEVREQIHETTFSDKENKISAGKAKGCIKTFVEEFEPGTGLVLNLPIGQAFARVTGGCIHDVDHDAAQVETDHVLRREVEFLRIGGELVVVEAADLPSGMRPLQPSISEVKSESTLEVAQVLNFFAGESL
jgi:hypothetical protein